MSRDESLKFPEIIMLGILILMLAMLMWLMVMLIGTGIQEIKGMNHYWVEQGDCFDKNSNRINELTCDVRNSCSENFISLLGKCEPGEVLK